MISKLVALFIVLCIVAKSANSKIDSMRRKKWFDEE
jgi:hypothetical protein